MSIESVMLSNHLILSSPSPLTLNVSQHQGLSQGVSSSHQVAKVLQLQHQCFQWIFRVDFLQNWLVWSLCYPRDSQESFPAPQLESVNCLVLSLLYGATLTSIHNYWKDHNSDYMHFVGKVMALLFNMLSRLVITFLSRSKHLLISWLQSPSNKLMLISDGVLC